MDDDQHRRASDRERFVEDFGLVAEDIGLTRMAGRLLGHLLVCNPAEQSSADLVAALQASKGSISTATRQLIASGIVERFTRTGDRRDHFRVRPGVWTGLLRVRLAQASRLHEVAERGIALLDPDDHVGHARIEELHDLYEFLEAEYSAIIKRWQGARAAALQRQEEDTA
jgi:DNA-binding transcriptional regulator GbsR (MarR family)